MSDVFMDHVPVAQILVNFATLTGAPLLFLTYLL